MSWAALLPAALGWFRANWSGWLVGMGMMAALVALKGCAGSNQPPVAEAAAGAAQSLSGTAQASSGATIEIPGRKAMPCPPSQECPECPAVRIVYDCKAAVAGGAASSVSAAASVGQSGPVFGLWAGGGAVDVFGGQIGYYGQFGMQCGPLMAPLRVDSSGRVSIGLDYRFK